MKFTFNLSKKAQQRIFIETGSMPAIKQTSEIDPEKLTPEQREMILPYIDSRGINIEFFKVPVIKPSGNLYEMEHFTADTTDPYKALTEFFEAVQGIEQRKEAQEEGWYAQSLYRKQYKNDLLNADIQQKVNTYFETINKEKKAELEKSPDTKVISIATRDVYGAYEYNFDVSEEWKAYWESYNEAAKARKATQAAAAAAEIEKDYKALQQWAKENGSDELKQRIELCFNWKKKALIEQVKACVPFLTYQDEYSRMECGDDRSLGNPSAEQMAMYKKVLDNLLPHMEASLRRCEDNDGEMFDYVNISAKVGSTSVDLVFA
jgi:hypothetical protein